MKSNHKPKKQASITLIVLLIFLAFSGSLITPQQATALEQDRSQISSNYPPDYPQSDQTSSTNASETYSGAQSSLIRQTAEQNLPLVALYDDRLLNGTGSNGIYNDTYLGIKNFWSNDIV